MLFTLPLLRPLAVAPPVGGLPIIQRGDIRGRRVPLYILSGNISAYKRTSREAAKGGLLLKFSAPLAALCCRL